jgi:predicted transporter
MTAKRLALVGLTCLVFVLAYTVMFPRLVATGHQPPAALGWALEVIGIGFLVASLIVAIATPARRR